MVLAARQGRVGRDEKDAASQRGTVSQLFADEQYGFILAGDGHEVRFTADTVDREEFDELRVGSEVRFDETQGSDGPDATLVELISIPYPTGDADGTLGSDDEVPEMPDIWNDGSE